MGILNEMGKSIYEFNKSMGWHSGPPDMSKYLMNLHSEISEMWEAWRKGELDSLCDKAPKMSHPLTCAEEELADILIRTLDTAVTFGVDLDRAVEVKRAYNATRPHRHGGKLA